LRHHRPGAENAPSAATSATSSRAPSSKTAAPRRQTPQKTAQARNPVVPRASGLPFFDDGPDDGWLPRVPVEKSGLKVPAVAELIAEAKRRDSDTLIVIHRDQLVVDRAFAYRSPIETQSITKTVAGLAVLALVADGVIPSLDTPVRRYLPSVRGEGAPVTLRHVLSHSSGLALGDAVSHPPGLGAADDRTAYAAALPREHPPGTRFRYNNAAAQLIAGVVLGAAEEPLDRFVGRRIFRPLGIAARDVRWTRDRSGRVQSYFGLQLSARALAQLGRWLLAEGRWEGASLLPAALVREAASPSAVALSHGLFFWRRATFRPTPVAVARWPFLTPLAKRSFRTEEAFFAAAGELAPAAAVAGLIASHPRAVRLLREFPDERDGFYAAGGLGQRLVIYPRYGLVAVRQHRRRPGDEQRERYLHWRAFQAEVEAMLTP
ncbi:MAG: serine hydrolase domain-containing protein, partial [Myxococcota bacterium]